MPTQTAMHPTIMAAFHRARERHGLNGPRKRAKECECEGGGCEMMEERVGIALEEERNQCSAALRTKTAVNLQYE